MKHIKFIVKVKRSGTHTTEYVQRIDRTPIQTTADRKLALIMGKFTGGQIPPNFSLRFGVSFGTG